MKKALSIISSILGIIASLLTIYLLLNKDEEE